MNSLLFDLCSGVADVIRAEPLNSGIQVLENATDELKESASVIIDAQISREVVAGSRIFVTDCRAIISVNRDAYTAEEFSEIFQNVIASIMNAVSDGGFSVFSKDSVVTLGFVAGETSTNYDDSVAVCQFEFNIWAIQTQ